MLGHYLKDARWQSCCAEESNVHSVSCLNYLHNDFLFKVLVNDIDIVAVVNFAGEVCSQVSISSSNLDLERISEFSDDFLAHMWSAG